VVWKRAVSCSYLIREEEAAGEGGRETGRGEEVLLGERLMM